MTAKCREILLRRRQVEMWSRAGGMGIMRSLSVGRRRSHRRLNGVVSESVILHGVSDAREIELGLAAFAFCRVRTGPPCATVMTIDDGFYSVYECAHPILRGLSFPFTVYVSTYYCVKQNPVFRLVVQYMFWKTEKNRLDVCRAHVSVMVD